MALSANGRHAALPRLAFLVMALALPPARPLSAQQPADQGGRIMGFLFVPWGATAEDVVAAYGKALMERTTEDGGQVLIYKDATLGKPVFSLFHLDQAQGLVKGVSSIPYGAGADCETVFRQAAASIQRTYPSLTPVEERKQDEPGTSFCDAAAAGKARWSIGWTDPVSGNSVRVTLEADERTVEVTYQSGAYKPQAQGTLPSDYRDAWPGFFQVRLVASYGMKTTVGFPLVIGEPFTDPLTVAVPGVAEVSLAV